MGFFSRLAGTVSSFFQIGGPASPAWKNNAGAIEARDSTDSTFALVRTADPASANDAVTLGFLSTPSIIPNPLTTFQQHKVRYLSGESTTNASGTPTAGQQYWGFSTLTFSGTPTKPVFATTTKLGATTRYRYSQTVTSILGAFESGYVNAGVAQYGSWRGNAPNRGGFLFRCRFALHQVGVTSLLHMFVGLTEISAPGVAFDWTTDTTACKLGIGFTAASTPAGGLPPSNWQAIESAHSPPHLTDLGPSFVITLDDFLEVILYAAPNDTKVTLIVNNLTTGASTTQTLNTNLPTNTTPMLPIFQLGPQTIASGTNSIDLSLMYLETFDG